mmetsp:Transcript_31443/g.82143  ORF Transcript_31443/g.82143 Transcript_31443/m.82143 type:complete len:277 (+) Transcript_31443:979-1809(+)
MAEEGLGVGLGGAATESEGHEALGEQCRVPRRDRVYDRLVHRPDLVPLHQVGVLGRAHRENERLEARDRHAAPQDAGDGGEARVVPALRLLVVHEPLQLALREQCAHKVDAREGLEVDGPPLLAFCEERFEVRDEPAVLWIAIGVLRVAQRVRHALDPVDDWARQIVCWVCLELVFGLCVRRGIAAVDGWVSHGAVIRRHVDLGAEAAGEALLTARMHLTPQSQILVHARRPVRILLAVEAVLLLLFLWRWVAVGKPLLDHLRRNVFDGIEVVGGV